LGREFAARREVLERQLEIEIYLRDCPSERLVEWLRSVVGPLKDPVKVGAAVVYPSAVGSVVVTPNIEDGPFVGVWFNTHSSPWGTDVECARQAARELACTVRCCPGQDFPEVPFWVSDTFLEISGGVEQLIKWE
jgi:hypothetical protein